MKSIISKSRAKKAKTRIRNAEKAASARPAEPFYRRRAAGVILGVLIWLTAIVLLHGNSSGIHTDVPDDPLRIFGDGLLLGIATVAAALLLRVMQPGLLRKNDSISLLFFTSALCLVICRLILAITDTQPHSAVVSPATVVYLLPVGLAPLLATILLNPTVGLVVGLWVAIAAAALCDYSAAVMLSGFAVTVLITFTASNVRRRAQLFRIALTIGAVKIICVTAISALNAADTSTELLLRSIAVGIVSGALTSILALLLIPFYETIFKITTDITLLELSDLGHPLLQRLALEAPGTYHHSLVVANLTQRAAADIGANGLLTRVCSYFHDIGKLTKPEFFTENQRPGENPHDDLTPSMSTLVITSHVKEGLSLAVLHKLPQPILDAIQEHHGTSLVYFFHHKARQQLQCELEQPRGAADPTTTNVEEGSFRYPGPRPRTREMAIIALADCVESASRSLAKPTAQSIEELVNSIVEDRIKDHQLDLCDLTFTELARIKSSFVFTLTSMHHSRVPYPKNENRRSEQTEVSTGENGDSEEAGEALSLASQSSRP
ncbi:MAG: HDIG domain-containing protein [Verrucomicrobia bacterium]|nr:HDIG domain-containing protein [Verrucomicrobiota bacterium]MDA1087437.1 HDIG domain-containing protein [Verrucomicrobiota bacterium]